MVSRRRGYASSAQFVAVVPRIVSAGYHKYCRKKVQSDRETGFPTARINASQSRRARCHTLYLKKTMTVGLLQGHLS